MIESDIAKMDVKKQIEDIDEVPYRIDAMLNQMKLADKLSEAAGMMVGNFANATPNRVPPLSLEDIFQHYFKELNCPVMVGFQIGALFTEYCSSPWCPGKNGHKTKNSNNQSKHLISTILLNPNLRIGWYNV